MADEVNLLLTVFNLILHLNSCGFCSLNARQCCCPGHSVSVLSFYPPSDSSQ